MFDNLGTALVQAVGFFAIFGFFVYQLLSDFKKPNKQKIKTPKKIVNELREKNNKPKKMGIFGKKVELKKEGQKTKKKGLFGTKVEPKENLEMPKKKGWFK